MAAEPASQPPATTEAARPENRPDTPSAAYKAMMPNVIVCRDVAKGTTHMRAQAAEYLPQHPAEERQDYIRRLNRAILFNGFGRTIVGLSGMVFRRDPELSDDVPEEIQAHLENVDGEGTHIDVFAKDVFDDALEVGHCGILVDVPQAPKPPPGQKVLSLADERAAGIRPRWVKYAKEDIISGRSKVIGEQHVLTQLVLRETVQEPVGAFGDAAVERHRVLRRSDAGVVTYELWEQPPGKSEPVIVQEEALVTNVSEIPFAVVYGKRTGLLKSIPPLVDLAWTNVSHYQVQSDHLYALHIASVPIFVLTGVDPKQTVEVGPNVLIKIPDPQGDAKYAEHSGAALGQTRQQLMDFKADMAVLGLAMLQHETRAAETAEAKRIDKSEQDSALATAARSLQDALEVALGFHADFMRLESGGSVVVNRDFEKLTLDAATINAYSQMAALEQISIDTMWQILAEGGALPDGFDPETEKDLLEQAQAPTPEPQPVPPPPPAPGTEEE